MAGDDGYPGMPRWAKIGGIIVLVLLLAVLGAVAFGFGGQHGPGTHGRPSTSDGNVLPTDVHEPSEDGHGNASAIAEGAREINVTADNFSFAPNEIKIDPGENVAIRLTSLDMLHDFTIDELDMHVAAEAGETNAGGFHGGRPGTYTFYCSEPGHREAGMEGTLTVEATPGHTRPAGH